MDIHFHQILKQVAPTCNQMRLYITIPTKSILIPARGTRSVGFLKKIFNYFREFMGHNFLYSLFKFDHILLIRSKNRSGILLTQVRNFVVGSDLIRFHFLRVYRSDPFFAILPIRFDFCTEICFLRKPI